MRLTRIVAVASALTLGAAAPAHADLYVDDDAAAGNMACTQAAPCNTIKKALMVAGSGDAIHVAAGNYLDTVATANVKVSLIGAGTADTYVAGVATTGAPAITMTRGGSVQGLHVYGEAGGMGNDGQNALSLLTTPGNTATYSLRDVLLEGGAPTNPTQDVSGSALLADGTTVTDGHVTLGVADSTFKQRDPGGVLFPVVELRGADATIAHSTVLPPTQGVGVRVGSGSAAIDNSEILATGGGKFGLAVGGNAGSVSSAVVRRSRIEGVGFAVNVATFDPGTQASAEVRDSLIVTAPATRTNLTVAGAWVDAESGGHATLTGIGSTFVARGPDVDAGVYLSSPDPGSNGTANLVNSAVRATDTDGVAGDVDVLAQYRSQFTAAHSSFSDVTTENGADATAPGSGTNLTGDPGFADEAGGNYSLTPGSPLVDRGDPAAVLPGELDFAGTARALDASGDCAAEPDIGAFERPAAPACVPPGGPAGPGGGGPDGIAPAFSSRLTVDNRTFRVGTPSPARAARAPRGTHFRFTISEAATLTYTIERKTTGRRSGKRCVRPTRKNRKRRKCTLWKRAGSFTAPAAAGANSTPWNGRIKNKALAPGTYRARVVARDAAGNKSAEKRATLKIVKR